MDKASRVLRRSGVKLMSLGAGYGPLNILLTDIKEVKIAAKAFLTTQNQAALDMAKWAAQEENKAVQDVVSHIAELYLVWTEVQKTFMEQLREYRQMFEMVLEGEKHVHQAKDNLEYCTEKEVKVRKELRKCAKRAGTSELRMLESRVTQAEQAKEMAEIEVSERVRENEAVKLIRLKEGLLKMSGAYLEMSYKSNIVFTAQRNVVLQLPDVHGQSFETLQYPGARTTQYIVEKAKEKIQSYTAPNVASDPPPPYTPPDPVRRSSRDSDNSQQSNGRPPPTPPVIQIQTRTRIVEQSRSRSGSESSTHSGQGAPPTYASSLSMIQQPDNRRASLPPPAHSDDDTAQGRDIYRSRSLPGNCHADADDAGLPHSGSREAVEHCTEQADSSSTPASDRLYPTINTSTDGPTTQESSSSSPRPVPAPRASSRERGNINDRHQPT